MISTGWSQTRICFLMLLCTIILPGCNAASSGYSPRWSSLLHRSAKIPHDATKEEIIAYVNQHIEPIHAWRSTSARVHISGIPIPMNAMLAVEQPRQLRFTVSSGLSGQSEFDLGSSEDRLWVFDRRAVPKAIVTVRHEEIEQIQDQMPIPIQPEWLMEVLNVSTIDAASADLVRDPDSPGTVKLVSHHTNKQGQEIRKIITIDLRKGEVRDHQLYDAQHRLLASAELNDYHQFPNTNAKLPYDIKLKFAQQNQTMRIILKSVDINPPHISKELWAIPHLAGYPVQEIGRQQLLNSPTAIANRKLRKKPKAITNYEHDPKTGAWVQDQIIQTASGNSAPRFNSPVSEQAGRQRLSDALPFSAHEFAAQPQQSAPQKRAKPAPQLSDAPLFGSVNSTPSVKPAQQVLQTTHQFEQQQNQQKNPPAFQAPPLPDFSQMQKNEPIQQKNPHQWNRVPEQKPKEKLEPATESADIPEWAKGFKNRTTQKPISSPAPSTEFELPKVR